MTRITDELLRGRFESERVALVPEELTRLRWSLNQMRGLRDRRLQDLVRHARGASAWHRERLADLEVEQLSGDDVSQLPTMTKSDLMANWDDIVCDPKLTLAGANMHLEQVASEGPRFLHGEHLIFASSGSSGMRSVIPWHWRDLLQAGLGGGRMMVALEDASSLPWHADDHSSFRVASIWGGNPIHATATAVWLQQATPDVEVESRSVATPVDELVDWLQAFPPDQLNSYSTSLEQLAVEALAGRLQIAPQMVIALAEPVTDRLRQLVVDAWGVGATNVYGATEAQAFAVSAPGQRELHLVEDLAIIESVDIAHVAVPHGTIGDRVLITGLSNRTMPLIRYELTDQLAVLPPDPDRHGDGVLLTPPQGRSDPWFVYPGGLAFHTYFIRIAIDELPAIAQFKVQQTWTGLDIQVRLAATVDLEPLTRRLTAELATRGLLNPDVTVRPVSTIARDPASAKLQPFVALQAT